MEISLYIPDLDFLRRIDLIFVQIVLIILDLLFLKHRFGFVELNIIIIYSFKTDWYSFVILQLPGVILIDHNPTIIAT